MDILTLGLTIGGIISGALITIIVSKYFFKKSIKEKKLNTYIQFSSRLFSVLDPELKKNLIVNFKNHKIDNITQAQFFIANTGDVPIKDIIEPLKLSLPKENKIFSVNIVHIEPEGREIKFDLIELEKENIIKFNIPLLNSGEYFVFKLLMQDKLPSEDDDKKKDENSIFKFTITADDLPPSLQISHLPYSYYQEETEQKYDRTFLWIGLISGLFFTVFTSILYAFKFKTAGLYLFSFKEFFNLGTFSFFNVCLILFALLDLIALILVIIGIVGSISELKPNEKPKFKIPKKLRDEKYSFPFEYSE
jgi:hypothetical protein